MSTSAHAGQPYLAPYVAAKAGLAGLTRNAAHAHRGAHWRSRLLIVVFCHGRPCYLSRLPLRHHVPVGVPGIALDA
jgi:hypothetical protein